MFISPSSICFPCHSCARDHRICRGVHIIEYPVARITTLAGDCYLCRSIVDRTLASQFSGQQRYPAHETRVFRPRIRIDLPAATRCGNPRCSRRRRGSRSLRAARDVPHLDCVLRVVPDSTCLELAVCARRSAVARHGGDGILRFRLWLRWWAVEWVSTTAVPASNADGYRSVAHDGWGRPYA